MVSSLWLFGLEQESRKLPRKSGLHLILREMVSMVERVADQRIQEKVLGIESSRFMMVLMEITRLGVLCHGNPSNKGDFIVDLRAFWLYLETGWEREKWRGKRKVCGSLLGMAVLPF